MQCRPTNDTCDAGTYCSPLGACTRGCRRASDCRTGLCLPSHDCVTCQGDTECEAGRVCGSGVCAPPCTTSSTCAPGWQCCQQRCVDPTRDPAHCGACNQPCGVARFCGAGQCRDTVLSNVCSVTEARALLDGIPGDDDAGITISQAVASGCLPPLVASAVPQRDSGVLATNGEPLLTGPLLCVGGGSFFQASMAWLETNGFAHVFDTSTGTQYRLSLRDGGVVAMGPASTITPTRDLFVLQLMRAPSGAVVLNASGFYAEGTLAGAWYVQNALVPMRPTFTSPFVVIEWIDVNGNGPDPMDTFTRLAP